MDASISNEQGNTARVRAFLGAPGKILLSLDDGESYSWIYVNPAQAQELAKILLTAVVEADRGNP